MFTIQQLLSDCTKIIQNLYANGKISSDANINFHLCFGEKWPNLAADVCSDGDTLNSSDIKDFRVTHEEYLTQSNISLFSDITY